MTDQAQSWELLAPFPGPVTLTVVGASVGKRRPGLVVRRVAEPDPRDVRRHRGLPVVAIATALAPRRAQA